MGCDVFCSLINLKCDFRGKAQARPQRVDSENRLEKIAVIVTKEYIGHGDNLGQSLLAEFLASLAESKHVPQYVIFMHRAVILCCENSPVIKQIKFLQKRGTSIKVCEKSAQTLRVMGDVIIGDLVSLPVIADICLKSEKVVWI